MTQAQSLAELLAGVEVIDLTQPLSEQTPVLKLPEPFVNTPGLRRHEISAYDDRGPAWAWYWLEIGEHVGTHFDAQCARALADSALAGVGVETVGTDAGAAHSFEPPFPVHHFVLGAGKYGITQLANLALLPPTGAVLVVAPLKLVGGTGSPARVLALVPRAGAAGPG